MIRPARLLAPLWASLAGRIVLLLTLGMALVAWVSIVIAHEAHRQSLTYLRMESVVSTTEDVFNRLSARPQATEDLLAAGLVRDIRVAPASARIDKPSPKITALLKVRLGPAANALGQVEPHGYCFVPGSLDDSAQANWPAIPDCWLIRFTDRNGATRRLAIRLPRYLSGGADTLDPLYLALIVAMSAVLASGSGSSVSVKASAARVSRCSGLIAR